MVFVCPEKCQQRKSLLTKLKDLVDQIDDKQCKQPSCSIPCNIPTCCPTQACAPCSPTGYCGIGPVIEIYDPLPKPCLPIVNPIQQCCSPCSGCPPCEQLCCAGTCPPPTTPVPVSCMTCPSPLLVPPCLPICTPVPPPCVPVCNPNPEEQPCVPCNPPQMMVCYRRPKTCNGSEKRSKSRELRASILHVGCDCEKRNGLQDDCPRWDCRGAPECLTKPDPICKPSDFANGKHLGKRNYNGKRNNLEEYQCYPAYVRLPPCSPCDGCTLPSCCDPCTSMCCPNVPLVAQAPCPPPVCPGPPPLVPLGTIVPTIPAVPCCPTPCCTAVQCCPPCPC